MAGDREERKLEIQFKVMRLLAENSSIITREIAIRVSISNGSAYYCVIGLIEKGFVKLKNFSSSKTKANYIYQLTLKRTRTEGHLTGQFLERKKHEYKALKAEIESLEKELGAETDFALEDRKAFM